jgi:hypothetical protein
MSSATYNVSTNTNHIVKHLNTTKKNTYTTHKHARTTHKHARTTSAITLVSRLSTNYLNKNKLHSKPQSYSYAKSVLIFSRRSNFVIITIGPTKTRIAQKFQGCNSTSLKFSTI